MRIALGLMGALLFAASALAEDRIVLSEVLPSLQGTELGSVDVGPSPPPGSARTVRRSEVLAALARAGQPAEGLTIPRAVRVVRSSKRVDSSRIAELGREALEEALSPCTVSDIRTTSSAELPGTLDVRWRAQVPPHRTTGSIGAALIAGTPTRELRIPVRVTLECPPPVFRPGAQVRIVSIVGPVRAMAPGEARQPGRIGEVIRVHNRVTGATLQARVVSEDTVEVVR